MTLLFVGHINKLFLTTLFLYNSICKVKTTIYQGLQKTYFLLFFSWGINLGVCQWKIINKIIFIFSYTDFCQIDEVVFLTALLCFLFPYIRYVCVQICAYMFVCVYVCMCICMYICVFVYMCVCGSGCSCVYTHTFCVCLCVHICILCICRHTCTYMHMYVFCVYIHTLCIHTCLYVYVCVKVFVYVYVCVYLCAYLLFLN